MARVIRLGTVKLALASLLILAFGTALVVPLIKLRTLPPSNYHPRAIYYRLKGIRVHPLIPIAPGKTYHLDVWTRDWPVRGTQDISYRDFLREIIGKFNESYPNVHVELSLLPFEEEMPAGWSQGDCPDIYLGSPDELPAAALGNAVPVTSFVEPGENLRYEPHALQAAGRDGEFYAWPHSIGLYGWAANRNLLEKIGTDPETIIMNGWTWDEFLALAQKIAGTSPAPQEESRVFGLVLDDSNSLFLEHLLLNNGVRSLIGPDGGPGWTPAQMEETLAFIKGIRSRGLFPGGGIDMSRAFLNLFWDGRTGFIGPVGPPFLRHLWDRKLNAKDIPASSQDVTPVLLPVPSRLREYRTTPIQLFAAWAFLNTGQKQGMQSKRRVTLLPLPEEIQARIAVELARELSRKRGTWLASKLKTVPAYRPDVEWQKDAFAFWELGPVFVRESLKYVKQGLPPGDIGSLRRSALDPLIRELFR